MNQDILETAFTHTVDSAGWQTGFADEVIGKALRALEGGQVLLFSAVAVSFICSRNAAFIDAIFYI